MELQAQQAAHDCQNGHRYDHLGRRPGQPSLLDHGSPFFGEIKPGKEARQSVVFRPRWFDEHRRLFGELRFPVVEHAREFRLALALVNPRPQSNREQDYGKEQQKDANYQQGHKPSQPISVVLSNRVRGSSIPEARSRSMNFGCTPVARNRPRTLPFEVKPVFSNVKMSCSVTCSPSIPTHSVTYVTRRVPSLMREICRNTSTAEATCCRIDLTPIFAFAIATITSMRLIASRGLLA